jgi:hypothetical protein
VSTVWEAQPVRRILDLVWKLPDTCSRMTLHEMLLLATLVTLVMAVILMMSGRRPM